MPARLFPIFRDREELPTTSDLSHAIDDALRDSLMLIVMCSPASAASQWVNEEIRAFKHLHGEDRILAIVIGGEPNATDKGHPTDECFPAALRYKVGPDGALTNERTEPIAADARPHGDGKEDALLKLLSGLLAVNFNDLKQREVQAARRRARVAQGIASVMAILAVAAIGAGWFAYRNQQVAEEQRAEAIEQREIAEAQTRRADAQREVAEAQKRLAEDRLREALIERTGRTIADGRAAAASGSAERAMALSLSALQTAEGLVEPQLTETATQLARDLLMNDRVEALLHGRYPTHLGAPAFGEAHVSPNGDTIMARRGNRLLLWRRMTGERLQRITGVAAASYRANGVVGGILDGGQVFAISQAGAASIVGGETANVRRAIISPTGDRAAFVDGAALVTLDMATGGNRRTLAIDAQDTLRLSWSPDGRYIGAADFDPARVRIWRVGDGATIVDFTPRSAVNRVLFGEQDRALIDADDEWRRVDLATGAIAPLLAGERIDDALFASDDTIIIDNALGAPVRLTPDGVPREMGETATYGLVGLRAEGREVLLRTARQFVLRDVTTGAMIRQIGRTSGAAIAGFHLSASGDYLAILDEANLITVWSLSDGRETLTYRPAVAPARIWMLDAPMGALLMMQDVSGHLSLHRVEAAQLSSMEIAGMDAPMQGGLVPVFSGYPHPSRLWDIATRHAVRELPGPVMAQDAATGRLLTRLGADLAITHMERPNPLRLRADAPRVVAATFGATARIAIQTPDGLLLLDTDTGEQLGAWDAVIDQTRAERSAAFTPDGLRFLLLTGHDGLLDINAESGEIIRQLSLLNRVDEVTTTSAGHVAIIAAGDAAASFRYDLATGDLSSLSTAGEWLGGGPHTAIIGYGPSITAVDAATGRERFSRPWLGEAYAAGPADRFILNHQIGDVAADEPDQLEALDANTGAPLWHINGRRPFGASWKKPVLSQNENWALVTNLGPQAGYLLDTQAGRIATVLQREVRSTLTLSSDDDLTAIVAFDGFRADAFDLLPAQAGPKHVIAMLNARTLSPPEISDGVTDCDRATAHPDDPMAVAPGLAVEDIPLEAEDLCWLAVTAAGSGPASARLNYQLSRALDASGQSAAAIGLLETLAARGYPMANHALGIWRLGGVGGGPQEAVAHFREAAEGGVGASWVVLARMAQAGMVDGNMETILQEGADAGAADAWEAIALSTAATGDLITAHRQAVKAALAAAPHRRYRFEALATTLARRLRAYEGDIE